MTCALTQDVAQPVWGPTASANWSINPRTSRGAPMIITVLVLLVLVYIAWMMSLAA